MPVNMPSPWNKIADHLSWVMVPLSAIAAALAYREMNVDHGRTCQSADDLVFLVQASKICMDFVRTMPGPLTPAAHFCSRTQEFQDLLLAAEEHCVAINPVLHPWLYSVLFVSLFFVLFGYLCGLDAAHRGGVIEGSGRVIKHVETTIKVRLASDNSING